MNLSLLVATVNRVAPLQKLFESLARQTYMDFEVLVADQNPPEILGDLITKYSKIFPLRVFPTPHRGVSQARNALLPHTRGELIAFPDDDCFYAPDVVERIVENFHRHPHLHGLLGQRVLVDATERYLVARPITQQTVNRFSAFRQSETYLQFYRREVIETISGFAPMLGPGTGLPYGCGEDTDYLLRALAAGYHVSRAEGARIYHPAPEMKMPDVVKMHAYGRGRMYLLRKHRFPLWFKLATVLYPLAILAVDFTKHGPGAARYRWAMFKGRLSGLFQAEDTKE